MSRFFARSRNNYFDVEINVYSQIIIKKLLRRLVEYLKIEIYTRSKFSWWRVTCTLFGFISINTIKRFGNLIY